MSKRIVKRIAYEINDNEFIKLDKLKIIKRNNNTYLNANFYNISNYIITGFKLRVKGEKINYSYEFSKLNIYPGALFFEDKEILSDIDIYDLEVYDYEYQEMENLKTTTPDITSKKRNNKLKYIFSGCIALLVGVVSLSLLVDRSDNNSVDSSIKEPIKNNNYRIGLGFDYDYDEANDYLDIASAFVAVDDNNCIYDVRFDSVTPKLEIQNNDIVVKDNVVFDTDGSIKTDLELGDSYGMIAASPILKEKYYQIESFANWCVGKNYDEIIYGCNNNDETLISNVTIFKQHYLNALSDALSNLSEEKYTINGKAGVSMSTKFDEINNHFSINLSGVFSYEGNIEAALIDSLYFDLIISEDSTIEILTDSDSISLKRSLKKYNDLDGTLKEYYDEIIELEQSFIGLNEEKIILDINTSDEEVNTFFDENEYLKLVLKTLIYSQEDCLNYSYY